MMPALAVLRSYLKQMDCYPDTICSIIPSSAVTPPTCQQLIQEIDGMIRDRKAMSLSKANPKKSKSYSKVLKINLKIGA